MTEPVPREVVRIATVQNPYTLGVEEEYQLLDGTSFDLVQHIETVLEAERLNAELERVRKALEPPSCL